MTANKTKTPKTAQATPAPLPPPVPKRILVPTDFSPTSIIALRYAAAMAGQLGARLDLLYVIEPAPFMSDMKNLPLAMSDQELADKSMAELTKLARREAGLAVSITPMVRSGKAYDQIALAAKELPADLIIIATHGYTGLKHTLLGSTAERVARHAPCPVLVVR